MKNRDWIRGKRRGSRARRQRRGYVLIVSHDPLCFYMISPQRPIRRPQPVDWSGWRSLGWTTDGEGVES